MMSLTDELRRLKEEKLRRLEAPQPLSFRAFVTQVKPRYQWYRHCEMLAQVLQRVADGEIKRLMVYEPPRHGKSEEVSRLFSAYFLYRFPERWVSINSYGAELAYTLSRAARENYQAGGGQVVSGAAAVRHWETGHGGGLFAAGVGGPITGKGWHLGIIDDPDKNAAEAASEVIQQGKREWYSSTFYTREEPWSAADPHGAIIVIQTRWNELDLGGWLLAMEGEDEPEGWHILCLPAIAEDEPPAFPPTCTVLPDWRRPGEPLCPERRPLDKLKKIEARIGSYFFSALFQQRPAPIEGAIFKRAWLTRRYKSLVGLKEVFTVWDTALKEKEENDESAFTVFGLMENGDIPILRAGSGHWDTPSLEKFLCEQATWLKTVYGEKYRGDFVEDKVSGTTLIRYIKRNRPDLAVIPIPAELDKIARAHGVTPIVEAERVMLPDATIYPETVAWATDFLNQICTFPKGRFKDLTDTFVYGLMRIMGTLGRKKMRRGKRGGQV